MRKRPFNEDWNSLLHLLGTDKECNLFEHIHGDKDIEELTAAIIRCSAESCRHATRFDEITESHLLNAMLALLRYYNPPSDQNLHNVIRMLNIGAKETSSSSLEEFVCRITGEKTADERCLLLDSIFYELEKVEPKSFAVNQYKTFRAAAGHSINSIFCSCACRLQMLVPALEKLSVREFCDEQD